MFGLGRDIGSPTVPETRFVLGGPLTLQPPFVTRHMIGSSHNSRVVCLAPRRVCEATPRRLSPPYAADRATSDASRIADTRPRYRKTQRHSPVTLEPGQLFSDARRFQLALLAFPSFTTTDAPVIRAVLRNWCPNFCSSILVSDRGDLAAISFPFLEQGVALRVVVHLFLLRPASEGTP